MPGASGRPRNGSYSSGASRRRRPARARGQNLLVHGSLAAKIVSAADLPEGATVVEIGAGTGTLTLELARVAQHVIAVEIEPAMVQKLHQVARRAANIIVIEADARRLDLKGLLKGVPYHVVSNLPYSVGTPLTVDLVQSDYRPVTVTVMLQLEVAQRLCARPGDTGLLSVIVQSFADAKLLFEVGPEAFRPRPKVQSALVRLVTNSVPGDDRLTRAVIVLARHAFASRRKKLQNSLAGALRTPTSAVGELCSRSGVDPGLRPQDLSLDAWRCLAREALAQGIIGQPGGRAETS